MYEYYDAVLHAVREGLLLLDRAGRLQLVNDEARRLLSLPEDAVGRRVDELGLPPALGTALAAGTERGDEIFLTDDRVVVVNQAAARWAGQDLGTVVTLRDHTELRALVSELKTIRGFAEALSAQAHESANQLQTVISLIELGRADEALRFAATELAVAQHLTDIVVGAVGEPELAALVLGKAAEASERGVELRVDDDLEVPAGMADPRDLVTIVGNLLDNAVDAAAEAPAPRWVRLEAGVLTVDGVEELELAVADSGPGLGPDAVAHAFDRGWTTKKTDRPMGRGVGLALVAQAVHRLGGAISVVNEVGAVFTVRLPRRGAAPRTGRERVSPRPAIRPGSPSTSRPDALHVYRRLAALRCPGCPPRRNFQTEQLRPRTAKTMVPHPHVRLRDGRGRRNDRWRIAMDLRFALFERIARDSVLSRLLVNYADRLDDSAFPLGPTADTCYLTMEWTTGDRTNTSSEGESLTVRAHIPRRRSEERPYLDVVLQRLDAAVAVDDADGSITVRRRVTSPDVVQTGADTIFRTRIYDVAAVPGRRGLPFAVDHGAIGSVPPDGAAPRR